MLYHILIFESIHKVLKAEKLLLEKGIKPEIVTTPKEISSECGMSIRLNPQIADMKKAAACLNDNDIAFSIYEKEMQ